MLIPSKNDGLSGENVVEQQIHRKNKFFKNAGEVVCLRITSPSPTWLFVICLFCCYTFPFSHFTSKFASIVSCILTNFWHFLSPIMSERQRKKPVTLTLQQRAEIFKLIDQQVAGFFIFRLELLSRRFCVNLNVL